MSYLIIIIVAAVILAGSFIWFMSDRKKTKAAKPKARSAFRTDDALEGYGKPLEDGEKTIVDFEDEP